MFVSLNNITSDNMLFANNSYTENQSEIISILEKLKEELYQRVDFYMENYLTPKQYVRITKYFSGISQKELAEEESISPTAIHYSIWGQQSIKSEHYTKIRRLGGVELLRQLMQMDVRTLEILDEIRIVIEDLHED